MALESIYWNYCPSFQAYICWAKIRLTDWNLISTAIFEVFQTEEELSNSRLFPRQTIAAKALYFSVVFRALYESADYIPDFYHVISYHKFAAPCLLILNKNSLSVTISSIIGSLMLFSKKCFHKKKSRQNYKYTVIVVWSSTYYQ